MSLKENAKSIKGNIPAVFLTLKDSRTPITAKIFASITIAYAFSPIDLIPDFIPVLGYIDDVILLPLLISLTIYFIPKDIWKDNCIKTLTINMNSKTKKWYYSIPIILIWTAITVSVICIFI